ncbi:DUF1501 domain-containing protein [Acanthopleuribacter pedis]|uniref:DUF1501 domain-containing protein n=1 Tax=Acanthopleuribacter pedis TaxID=442870 RepID=A0A8J7U290_9BACT|nr:DUF1501 domain-containing protein [Acanthopleuribacter pedis]MBO1317459.1 DUF1501 domain-containing protein [Acanthopleuribacter pedis]
MQRRSFLTSLAGAVGLGLTAASPAGANWRALPRQRSAVQTRNTARNLIMVLLDGGPSHVDTFDLKVGRWTPNFIGQQTIGGSLQWPMGIMPKLGAMTNQFAIIRSISAIEAVHERAVYHLITAHRQSAALAPEIPHFASVMSHMMAGQRGPNDKLPTFVSVGTDEAHNGFLNIDHAPLIISEEGRIANIVHGIDENSDRLQLLDALIALHENRTDAGGNHALLQQKARRLMGDQELATLLGGLSQADAGNGGGEEAEGGDAKAQFVRQCKTAVNVLAAGRGTRVMQLRLEGWDQHENIYVQGEGGLSHLAGALDEGLATLYADLQAQPGLNGGTLLDETLVVAVGEFGRTVGNLNASNGRDHYPYVTPALLFGGGVKGGRVIGQSSADGGAITDAGWSHNRFMSIGDLVATMYSALGIDWTQRFLDTPSGRAFELVDSIATGPVHEIQELFV